MRMNDPDTCDHFAKTFGTKTTTKVTERTEGDTKTGHGSVREVEQYIFHPNVFKNLGTGVGIVSIPHRDGVKLMKIKFAMQKNLPAIPLPVVEKKVKPRTFPPSESGATKPHAATLPSGPKEKVK